MTLADLKKQVDALLESGVSPSTEVLTEGCDCVGYALDVDYDQWGDGDKTVMVTRDKKRS